MAELHVFPHEISAFIYIYIYISIYYSRLWRSNSSISSRTGCPPDIVNEEDHNVDDSEIPDFTNWTIPKVDTKCTTTLSHAVSLHHSPK